MALKLFARADGLLNLSLLPDMQEPYEDELIVGITFHLICLLTVPSVKKAAGVQEPGVECEPLGTVTQTLDQFKLLTSQH